jgi:hypothetical protein
MKNCPPPSPSLQAEGLRARISAESFRLELAYRKLDRSTSDAAYARRFAEVASISGRLHKLRTELNRITN